MVGLGTTYNFSFRFLQKSCEMKTAQRQAKLTAFEKVRKEQVKFSPARSQVNLKVNV